METKLFAVLFLGGTIGHLLMRRSGDFGAWLMKLGNRGDAATDTKPVTFTPEQQEFIDKKIIGAKYAQWKEEETKKYGDYDHLKQFKTEHEKQQDVLKQKELEAQKNYDEAKKGYEAKITDFSGKLTAKDQEIQNLRIEHALGNEISRQNGYAEETIAMIKSSAFVDDKGNVLIKSKDANGIDVNIPVADGVKKFLTDRPYLVRSTHKPGGGTGAGDGAGAGSTQTNDLNSLNKQMVEAMNRGDRKAVGEIKLKIQTAMQGRGVSV